MSPIEREEVLRFMLDRHFLFEDQGLWSLGSQAEEEFGRRYFLDLVSAFTAEGLFSVRHGDLELGWVHHLTFALRRDGPAVLLLAGRSWTVQHVDWPARVAYVVPSEAPGLSRWLGDGIPAGFDLCQRIARVLRRQTEPPATALTKRASKGLDDARQEFAWLPPDGTALRSRPDGRVEWWTFAGARANAALAATCAAGGASVRRHDNFSITFTAESVVEIARVVGRWTASDLPTCRPPVEDEALDGLKFSVCLPPHLARLVLERRAEDARAVGWARGHQIVTVG